MHSQQSGGRMSGHDIDPFAAPLLEETAPPPEEIPPPQAGQIQAVVDWLDIGGPRKRLPARIEKSPKYPEFVRAMHALNWRQRKFVKLLPKANYVAAAALAMLPEASLPSIYRWMHAPKVKAAIELQMEMAAEVAGVDPVRVVLQIADVARYCSEEVPLFSRDGKPLGVGRRDVANQLRALEMLAKHVGVIKPADNRSTTIHNNAPTQFVFKIISSKGEDAKQITGSGAVIDAECTPIEGVSTDG
jgi:hypothetical protein